MVSIEYDGNRLVNCIKLVEEIGGCLIGNADALDVCIDSCFFIGRQIGGVGILELIIRIPIAVWRMVLHRR